MSVPMLVTLSWDGQGARLYIDGDLKAHWPRPLTPEETWSVVFQPEQYLKQKAERAAARGKSVKDKAVEALVSIATDAAPTTALAKVCPMCDGTRQIERMTWTGRKIMACTECSGEGGG